MEGNLAIGFRSLSDSSLYEYKQGLGSFNAQVSSYYHNAFYEIFAPSQERTFQNVISYYEPTDGSLDTSLESGIEAYDSYQPSEYEGLSEEELKWLIENNVVTRDPSSIKVEESTITYGKYDVDGSGAFEASDPILLPLYNPNVVEYMRKSPFLMALHKATYGVIESRPAVFEINAWRTASPIWWAKIRDLGGNWITSVQDRARGG
jgi:hypothetical protein